MTAILKPTPTRWMWLLAGVLMLGEFLLFDAMTSRYHASIYPRWNDQIQYLTDAYTAYDHMQAHGLAAGLKFALGKSAVQGTLHDAGALVVFWLAGSASRSAALSLNMLVFLAWQAALLFTIFRSTGSRVLAWMGFGLLLCVARPWAAEAGTAVDFRLDHGAMCLFGIASCAALLTRGFRSAGWSLAFGVAAGVTILERFLTAAYFGPIFVLLALWLLTGTDRLRRLRNLLLAGGVVAVMTLPVFWINREGILNYYWVGQVTGAESAARLRGFEGWQSVQFVFGNLAQLQLGAWFGWTVAALTALLFLIVYPNLRKPAALLDPDWLSQGFIFVLLPAAILTYHRQKSEVVLGILVPGVLLLVLWLWRALWVWMDPGAPGTLPRILTALPAIAAIAAGGYYFSSQELRPPHSRDFLEGARHVNRLADYIFRTVRAGNLSNPSVGIDQIADFMDGRILRVICYERHKTWINFGVNLPDSILAGPDEAVLFKLTLCDFMFITDWMPHDGYWPYDKQMRRLYPQLKSWCDANLVLIDTFTAFEREMSVYQRKGLPLP